MQREWAHRRDSVRQNSSLEDGRSTFENFCIVGLHPDDARIKGGKELSDNENCSRPSNSPSNVVASSRRAEILFSFPETMPADFQMEIPWYCYPQGVKTEVMRRTSSFEAINDVIYGNQYQTRDDYSSIFLLQTMEPGDVEPKIMYCVCCYRKEFVHRMPAIMIQQCDEKVDMTPPVYPLVATRCYCLISRLPTFQKHFQTLHRLMSYERHFQIDEFNKEVDIGLWKTPKGVLPALPDFGKLCEVGLTMFSDACVAWCMKVIPISLYVEPKQDRDFI